MNLMRLPSVFLLLTIIFTAGCGKTAEPVFSISGSIKNYQSGKLILTLEEDINRKQSREIGEISVDKSGKFEAGFDLEPNIYTLDFFGKKKLMLAIDKGQKIVIDADANDLSKISVSGSPDTEKLEAYEDFRKKSLASLVTTVRDDIKKLVEANDQANDAEINKLGNLEIENFNKHKDELIDFVGNNMGTSVAIYATSLRWDGDKNVAVLEKLAADFERVHPNLSITSKVKEKVQILKNTSLGGVASDIRLPNQDGNEKTLSSVKARYILIDFWGSWCGPCRREANHFAELYGRFNRKGFEIFGVGLESEKEAWVEAINEDKRIWTNVSLIQEFETPATFDYAVTSLPANFLIDADRKIIGKNLHGKELEEKLGSLFTE